MRRGLKYVPPALLLFALLELTVFVLVGRAVGFGAAVLLVFGASLLGLVLLRREGMRAWRGFRAAAQAGRPPGAEVTDGLVGLLGALLLAMPGLVSGVVGLLLLVPPLRRLAGGGVRRATERRVSSMVAGDLFGPRRVRVYRGAPQPTPEPAPAPSPGPVPSPQPVTDPGKAIEGEIVDR
ncbi:MULTISPECIES: FxsA family protein [unclassified Micromonospora]|uniref:FxsA family protein n=1 Tax=unclassified Micromonospora TaxID=2617518 RepID=UPI00188E72D0|nr:MULTISPECIES: FxsA family protein [unclassified Micromonospora]MBF5032874.1 FxsA family protein [Micromonospora sp. ANENR4]MCZ7475448.1 FxsA family protein [Micromonospora sp. WMMC273]WBC06064.1 FxsA family protein [Micromonospora sp. WMMA1976]